MVSGPTIDLERGLVLSSVKQGWTNASILFVSSFRTAYAKHTKLYNELLSQAAKDAKQSELELMQGMVNKGVTGSLQTMEDALSSLESAIDDDAEFQKKKAEWNNEAKEAYKK